MASPVLTPVQRCVLGHPCAPGRAETASPSPDTCGLGMLPVSCSLDEVRVLAGGSLFSAVALLFLPEDMASDTDGLDGRPEAWEQQAFRLACLQVGANS